VRQLHRRDVILLLLDHARQLGYVDHRADTSHG
jgi:hypothetical protein